MEKVYNHLKTEMSTKAFMKMEIHMDMASTFGKMALFIKEISFKAFDMEKEIGQV